MTPMDRSKYPPDWPAISKKIRKLAEWRCECRGRCGLDHGGERCGAANGEPHPVTGSRVVLTVAHLDHDTTNNGDSNLMALCQRCHLALDADQHAISAHRTRERKKGQAQLFPIEETKPPAGTTGKK